MRRLKKSILFWKQFSANEVKAGNLVMTKQNECKCICRMKLFIFKKNSWFQLMWILRWCLFASFFKAGCKLVSLSRMTFPPVLFMSRRLRYLLRMCRTWQWGNNTPSDKITSPIRNISKDFRRKSESVKQDKSRSWSN